MTSIRLVILVLILTGTIAFHFPAQAQNFNEINQATSDNSADISAQARTDEPRNTDQGAQQMSPSRAPQADMTRGEDERIKQVMGKDEYKQFVAAKAYAERASTYTLGPTDMIDITVLRHPEVSGQFTINMEGKIQFEFVGDLPMSGYTKEKATEVITKALSKYIVDPQVTVKIVGYNSKIVYVVGEVGNPGKIFMRGDTISVREALLDAGLPLLSANTTHASMFTPSDNGKVERRNVNVEDLLYKGDLRQNFVMRPGDTLYLPATFWAKAMRVITPVTSPVGQAAGTGRTIVGY